MRFWILSQFATKGIQCQSEGMSQLGAKQLKFTLKNTYFSWMRIGLNYENKAYEFIRRHIDLKL